MDLKLPKDFLDRVFPFHAYFDTEDRLVALGPSLSKFLPHLTLGTRFCDAFKVTAPDSSLDSPQDFVDQSLYLLRDRHTNMGLKAQCIEVEPDPIATADGQGRLASNQPLGCGNALLLLNPRVHELESLNQAGLKLTDFPSHDSFTDYLVALQTQKLALRDASALADRLTESNAHLLQREAMLSSLIRNVPHGGVIVLDKTLNVMIADGSELPFDRVSTNDEPLSLEQLINDTTARQTIQQGIARLFERGESRFQITVGDKIYSCATEQFVPFESNDIAALIVLSDITDSRLAEEQRIRNQRLEALGVLAGGLAHDFNNLLTAVLGNLSLIESDTDMPPKRSRAVQDAMTACSRATELTAQLLTFAKGGEPRREAADMKDIVSESISLSLRGTGVTFEVDAASKLPQVHIDAGQMVQVFNNLLINAAQAMSQTGRIKIRIQPDTEERRNDEPDLADHPWIRIDVVDEGPGISEDERDKLFDPYFTTKPDGHGLGLAVSFSIVERHGGFIRVDSQPGQGSTFSVHLPAEAANAPSNVLQLNASANHLEHLSQPCRVLIMDDETALRILLSRMLRQLGHNVTACENGEQAIAEFELAQASGQPYTHVILDLTVRGGMGGIEAAESLRQLDERAEIILTSGYSNDLADLDQSEIGVSAILTKPFTMAHLAGALERAGIAGTSGVSEAS